MRYLMTAVLLFTALGAAAAETKPIKAEWKSYYYQGPTYRRYECANAMSAVEEVLAIIDARKVYTKCSWNYGLSADWEALTLVKEDPSGKAIGMMFSSRVGPFTGLDSKWRELSGKEGVIEARWQTISLQRRMNDLRACNTYVRVLDYLLDELPVRNISQTVFCNTGMSYIHVRFDYLRPKFQPGAKASAPMAVGHDRPKS